MTRRKPRAPAFPTRRAPPFYALVPHLAPGYVPPSAAVEVFCILPKGQRSSLGCVHFACEVGLAVQTLAAKDPDYDETDHYARRTLRRIYRALAAGLSLDGLALLSGVGADVLDAALDAAVTPRSRR